MINSSYANPGDCCAPKPAIDLAAAFSRFLAYLKDREKQYRDLSQLSAMSDAQLRDIGLHRGDIRNAVYGQGPERIYNENMVKR